MCNAKYYDLTLIEHLFLLSATPSLFNFKGQPFDSVLSIGSYTVYNG